MKKYIFILMTICFLPVWAEDETEPVDYGAMFNWETYASYYSITEMVKTSNAIYCLSDGAVFSLDLTSKELTRWNKQAGLNGGTVKGIYSVPELDQVLVIYGDNMIDLIDTKGRVFPIRDLYQTTSKAINIQCVCVHEKTAYLGTDFGIIAINLKKREVADTYYIGEQARDISVTAIAVCNDSLFALTPNLLLKASLESNLINYMVWENEILPIGSWIDLASFADYLWAIKDDDLMVRQAEGWTPFSDQKWTILRSQTDKLFAVDSENKLYEIKDDLTYELLLDKNSPRSAVYDAQRQIYWIGCFGVGLVEWDKQKQTANNTYVPNGPIKNNIYSLSFSGEKLFVCPGYRWGDRGWIDASIAYLNPDGFWGYEPSWRTADVCQKDIHDLVAVGVDPQDNSHFFMSSYGDGLIEYRNNKTYKHFTEGKNGCAFQSLVEGNPDYVRTEGATVDNLGYLWVIQPEKLPTTIHLMNLSTEQWTCFNLYSGGQRVVMNTPKGIWIDKRAEQLKWMIGQRNGAALVLLDDNGTPANPSDDRCMARTSVVDQNDNTIQFSLIYDFAQDKNNDIWLGLEGGIIIVPASEDFLHSNQCRRVIIPRNDGTGLADYLLSNDNVRTVAVDGGNRKWLGTESSGVYLVSEDGQKTIYHFTEENSPLPSNYITDIAIHPTTGEVFIGTSAGLISFRSDASESAEDYNTITAYPNPVRPNFDGVVTISGLTEGTVVNIIDQGGQLVCKTYANGGTAVWDLKNGDGKRVSSGIYTALCNDVNGKHSLVKVMVMNR